MPSRRITKACDQCREAKSRCERRGSKDSTERCKRCKETLLKCTSRLPSRRRGPPKGYLQLVETKMHELEAVMGVLLSIPDPGLQQVIRSLDHQDELINSVFSKVTASPFGPHAIQEALNVVHADSYMNAVPSPPPKPTNTWQRHVLRKHVQAQITAKGLFNNLVTSEIGPYQFPHTAEEQFDLKLETGGSDSGSSSSKLFMMGDSGSSISPISLNLTEEQERPRTLSAFMDFSDLDLDISCPWSL